MDINYKKFWKLLIDKDMKKKYLPELANISTYTINKMNQGNNVSTDTLSKICRVVNCIFNDIMEVLPEDIGR